MSTPETNKPLTAQESLDLLNKNAKRVEQLSTRRTRIQLQLETSQAQYEKAVAQAKELFGTSDLAQLRSLLESRVEQNNNSVKGFVQALNVFERHIEQIETALSDPKALDDYLQQIPSTEEIAPAADPQDNVPSFLTTPPTSSDEFNEEDI